jgi:hypothetical protein
VALDAVDAEHPVQGPAASVLDRVAEPGDRRRLADDAGVDAFVPRLQRADNGRGAVDRAAFLIRGEEQRERPAVDAARVRRSARPP